MGLGSGVQMRMLEDPQLTGWLVKQGHIHQSWRRRWFVLKGNLLWYFKAEQQDAIGVIVLEGAKVCAVGNKGMAWCIEITHPRRPPYLLCCDNPADRDEWLQALWFSHLIPSSSSTLANLASTLVGPKVWTPTPVSNLDARLQADEERVEGWVRIKQLYSNHFRLWYCVLSRDLLYLFHNELNRSPHGVVEAKGLELRRMPDKPLQFELSKQRGDNFGVAQPPGPVPAPHEVFPLVLGVHVADELDKWCKAFGRSRVVAK